MTEHHRPNSRIVPPPADYARPISFVSSGEQPTFAERMVLFFRLNGEAISFWFAMFAIALLVGVVAGAYVGVVR